VDHGIRIQAFKALLSKCLVLTDSDELLVIYDESMAALLTVFEEALADQSISCTLIYLPRRFQNQLVESSRVHGSSDKVALPSALVAAITASTAMLNLLDSYANNASVRRAINRTPRPSTCRLATIPGISDAILQAIIDADVDRVLKRCEEVAWLLGEASDAEIVSHDSIGGCYKLMLSLGGWENEPIMSPGVLLPGSWGNVPPGETFCCPPFESVNGQICINGSIPGRVLPKGQELVLEFEKGKLVRWRHAVDGLTTPASRFFDDLKRNADIMADENWNTFAELGFGLNENITELTGNPLFDEKASETLHVAIGDNSIFDDDVSSFIHEDLVVKKPTLYLDGKLVMTQGVINDPRLNARRESSLSSGDGIGAMDAVVYLREGRMAQHNGIPMRRLSKAQRVNYVRLAPDETSLALGAVCEMLQAYERVHITTFLKAHPVFSNIDTTHLLRVLYHYRVIQFETPRQ
jgi:leucyl aminopeptidase (aminopeptidase T)